MFYHWIVPSESFTWHELTALLGTPLVDGRTYGEKTCLCSEGDVFNRGTRELLTVTSEYGASCFFYTDGFLIEGCAGFAVHEMGVGGSQVRLVFSLLS
jgi:hypothetical protein